jgi:hypothetical protein
MSMKHKFLSGVVAVTLAAGSVAGSVQQSEASGLSPAEAALIAGTAGFFVGTAVGHGHRGHHEYRHHHRRNSWERHVRRCYAHYRTYSEYTDTYRGYDGNDHYCRL